MSEIKPVYQSLFIETEFHDGWRTIDKQTFEDRSKLVDRYQTRILYPASAYEALQENCAKLLGEQDSEYNKRTNELINRHVAQVKALQKENAELKRNHKFTCENLANTVPFIEELEQKNAAQAKRIADLEETNGLLQTQVHCLEMVAASKDE